ncbi:hypothetical protein PC116_g6075 [Phytophthora cactorum]|uniref:Uncharacterized protein n=1 Tax=Phytophthora cactorum TaxID=29920 RepID=A0A8T1EA07_9STRA|nr:hypothetical protein PC114_g3715 [Phytophthora cactorum]KAG2948627.1 hypothetical protein PC117_g5869 [Phytophthora cactorum]KAG3040839.1 hypothetical protein PC119_g1129 [Phytophthora cactorum]KAG4058536.1 hypothetical protein PC123_g6510 [Phytophthora cactorum]KAG4246173.1 hypothetical protein PC116_g6075 [Phytophthora cactorum]
MYPSNPAFNALQDSEVPLHSVQTSCSLCQVAKMLICLDRKVVSLFVCGEHVTRAIPSHSRNLTAPQKDFAKQMARAGMKPARIHTAMLLHFGLRPSELPALQKVQNVVCYCRRTKLGG